MSTMSRGKHSEEFQIELVFAATEDAAKRIGRVYSILLNAALRSEPGPAADIPAALGPEGKSGGCGKNDTSEGGL